LHPVGHVTISNGKIINKDIQDFQDNFRPVFILNILNILVKDS